MDRISIPEYCKLGQIAKDASKVRGVDISREEAGLILNDWRHIWHNNGVSLSNSDSPNERALIPSRTGNYREFMKDLWASPDAPVFVKVVMTEDVLDAIDPAMTISNSFVKIDFEPGIKVGGRVIGDIDRDIELAEGEEYPTFKTQIAEGITVTAGKKFGLEVQFTEEQLMHQPISLTQLAINKALRYFTRYKEVVCANTLLNQGTVVLSNTNPATAIYGRTTGRNIAAVQNGSLTSEDVFEAYSYGMVNGYAFNLIYCNAATWPMWVSDPTLRYMFANGVSSTNWWNGWGGGNPASRNPWSIFGKIGHTTGQGVTPSNIAAGGPAPTGATTLDMRSQSHFQIPNMLGMVPFSFVVSPWMPIDVTTNTTDLVMCQDGFGGGLIVETPLQIKEWWDDKTESYTIRFKERYTSAIIEEGTAIAIIEGITMTPNKVAEMASVVINDPGIINRRV